MKKVLFIVAALCASIGAMFFFGGHEALGSTIAVSPLLANMSRAELEAFADQALSENYEGAEEYENFMDLDEDDFYEGFDDPSLSFLGSSRSFLDEKKSGVYLTLQILNNSGYTKTVCLNPAYYDTKGLTIVDGSKWGDAGAIKLNDCSVAQIVAGGNAEIDAVIADGVIYGTSDAGITVTGINGKVIDHLHFIKKNATRIPEMVIASVKASTGAIDTTFYGKIMTIRQVSPYRRFGDTNIDLQDFFKVEQYQSGKITVDTTKYHMQADEQTLVFVQIDDDTKLTVTFKIGGIHNSAQSLYKKAQKAHRNITQGTAGTVPAPVLKGLKAMKNKQLNFMRKLAFKKGSK